MEIQIEWISLINFMACQWRRLVNTYDLIVQCYYMVCPGPGGGRGAVGPEHISGLVGILLDVHCGLSRGKFWKETHNSNLEE